VARALYRVTRTYGVLALVVPLIGLVLAAVQGRLGEIWITLAMVLTAVAGGLLALRIVPLQKEAIDAPDEGMRLRTLGALTGVFNLLWATVVVLMIVRPGAS
jgi:zinc transporter ZupT